MVQDEDGSNHTNYKSNKLALQSAGDYGNKPITRALTEFIKGWEFYDFQPGHMRGSVARLTEILTGRSEGLSESPKLMMMAQRYLTYFRTGTRMIGSVSTM